MTPGALYDLSGRVSHAKAVAACLGKSIPMAQNEAEYHAACRLADLAGAIEDILSLAEADVEELERQLKSA